MWVKWAISLSLSLSLSLSRLLLNGWRGGGRELMWLAEANPETWLHTTDRRWTLAESARRGADWVDQHHRVIPITFCAFPLLSWSLIQSALSCASNVWPLRQTPAAAVPMWWAYKSGKYFHSSHPQRPALGGKLNYFDPKCLAFFQRPSAAKGLSNVVIRLIGFLRQFNIGRDFVRGPFLLNGRGGKYLN